MSATSALLGRTPTKIENIRLDQKCAWEKRLSNCYSVVNNKEISFIILTPERVGEKKIFWLTVKAR